MILFFAPTKVYTQYLQVSQTVQNAKILERELATLDSSADHHEKLLITMDYGTRTYNVIQKLTHYIGLQRPKNKDKPITIPTQKVKFSG